MNSVARGNASIRWSRTLYPKRGASPSLGRTVLTHARSKVWLLRRQLLHQSLRLLQIAHVEPFGKPPIDRSEKLASLLPLAVVAPEPCEVDSRTQLPEFGAVAPRCSEGKKWRLCSAAAFRYLGPAHSEFSEAEHEVCINLMGLPCDGSCGGNLDRAPQNP